MFPGFYPDPSICQVGEDYYLATSTFEYLPGIPVFHSRDLVDWELIGHVVDRPGQSASRDVPTNGGAWAPTIRYRDGTFYVVVTDAMGRGMLIFTATDPRARGATARWSTASTGSTRISLGRATAPPTSPIPAWTPPPGAPMRGHGGILQITVDLASGKPLSAPRSLWSGTGLKFPEAPHLYRTTATGTW